MKLNEVIKNLDNPVVSGDAGVEVSFLTSDSREVKPGAAFVAVAGGVDGHAFIDQAIQLGAVVIIAEVGPKPEQADKVTWVHAKHTNKILAELANAFHNYASDALKVIGVTGTNGKTTTTDCRGMAMEVSSHGLAQNRVGSVNFDVGVFSNLTQDHLDYHGNMESYYRAKLALFEQMIAFKELGSEKRSVAVINTDDQYGQRMVKDIGDRMSVWSYGMNAHSDFKFSKIRQTFKGSSFQLDVKGKSYLVQVPLIGRFNVYNVVSAITACAAAGMKVRDACGEGSQLCSSSSRTHGECR